MRSDQELVEHLIGVLIRLNKRHPYYFRSSIKGAIYYQFIGEEQTRLLELLKNNPINYLKLRKLIYGGLWWKLNNTKARVNYLQSLLT
tara:strand:+ start:311 stop:574 length:264 start_codon:yes stop_codon:yes gene_type:complete